MGEGVTVLTQYRCDICGRLYKRYQDAMDCHEQGFHPTLLEGDIAIAGINRLGWFDGDPKWVAQEVPGDSGTGKLYTLYFVVTRVDGDDRDAHRPRYHLFTKAMTGEQGWQSGWTFNEHHIRPQKVENPPKYVVETSKEVLGRKSEWLL